MNESEKIHPKIANPAISNATMTTANTCFLSSSFSSSTCLFLHFNWEFFLTCERKGVWGSGPLTLLLAAAAVDYYCSTHFRFDDVRWQPASTRFFVVSFALPMAMARMHTEMFRYVPSVIKLPLSPLAERKQQQRKKEIFIDFDRVAKIKIKHFISFIYLLGFSFTAFRFRDSQLSSHTHTRCGGIGGNLACTGCFCLI